MPQCVPVFVTLCGCWSAHVCPGLNAQTSPLTARSSPLSLSSQLRALLGSYDQLPPGDHKFLLVMRKVAAIWAPGQWAIDTVGWQRLL